MKVRGQTHGVSSSGLVLPEDIFTWRHNNTTAQQHNVPAGGTGRLCHCSQTGSGGVMMSSWTLTYRQGGGVDLLPAIGVVCA